MAWQDLQNDPPENLIEYIQVKDDPDYTETAKDAFSALIYLYQKHLLEKLIPICINWGYDKQVATEIAYNTFDRIWKYPKYDKTKINCKDPHKSMVLYLLRIAQNLLANYKKAEESHYPFTGDEQIIWDFPDLGELNTTAEKKAILVDRYELIKNALARLSPKHKIIYLTYKQYEQEINDGHKLPRELLKRLREELDISQNSIRVYKNEAFQKVDEYLNLYGSK
jgi:DNA-directed RNA polymerase specialized sigma24 family protein